MRLAAEHEANEQARRLRDARGERAARMLEFLSRHMESTNPKPRQRPDTMLGDYYADKNLIKGSTSMKLWARIEKAVAQADGTLEVRGVISSETEDDQGETVLASAMKSALPRYMLYPTIRRQHHQDPIGRALEVETGDDGHTRIVAKIVDDNAIKMIRHKVLNGFSIGGAVLQRDSDNPRIITKLRLDEVSACDRPANPDCQIVMYKRSWFEPQPFWDCGMAGHNHGNKIEAARCRAARAVAKRSEGVRKITEKKQVKRLQKAAEKRAAAILNRPIVPDTSDPVRKAQGVQDFTALYYAGRQQLVDQRFRTGR